MKGASPLTPPLPPRGEGKRRGRIQRGRVETVRQVDSRWGTGETARRTYPVSVDGHRGRERAWPRTQPSESSRRNRCLTLGFENVAAERVRAEAQAVMGVSPLTPPLPQGERGNGAAGSSGEERKRCDTPTPVGEEGKTRGRLIPVGARGGAARRAFPTEERDSAGGTASGRTRSRWNSVGIPRATLSASLVAGSHPRRYNGSN